MEYAGFWRRLLAYTIDIIPVTLLASAGFYLFGGFGDALEARLADPGNSQARVEFLAERNMVRDTAFLLYMVYATLMEWSPLQATLGKILLGLQVVGPDGERLTLGRSIARNLLKPLSAFSCGIGFIWVAFSSSKRAWHDSLSNTDVILE